MVDEYQRIESLERNISLDPKSRAFVELGELYRSRSEYEKAIGVLSKGLKFHPLLPPALLSLGRTYFEFGEMGQAQRYLEDFLDVVPEHLLANKILAKIYLSKNMMEEAQDALAQILLIDPNDRYASRQLKQKTTLGREAIDTEDDHHFDGDLSKPEDFSNVSPTMRQIYQKQSLQNLSNREEETFGSDSRADSSKFSLSSSGEEQEDVHARIKTLEMLLSRVKERKRDLTWT
ncbi:MAG: tetratricopeptide repeat protein [Bdellovibrionales bacterium]|nr:tetratricopeptide repeat protein [Bdellovibrionales bacterium]